MISPILSTELTRAIGGTHIGNEVLILGVNRPDLAKENELFFLEPKFLDKISATASIVLVSPELKDKLPPNIKTIILVDNLRNSLPKLSKILYQFPTRLTGIHPSATINSEAIIDKTANIGANTVIEAGAKISANVIIEPNCFIGSNVCIGENSYISSNVSIHFDTQIGKNTRIGSGSVIGYDGFGFVNIDGISEKLWHLSYVSIGDNVEIGANACIDKGFVSPTIISDNVKLDNLIQVGHNVEIGNSTVISGGTLIGGSTKIGKNCLIGGGGLISDHLIIEDNTIMAGGSQAASNLSSGIYGSFLSARPLREWRKIHASLKYLPKLIKKITLEEKI